MGTNYYLHRNKCPHCNRADAPWHIGKSSAGWCFGLHVMPDNGINDLEDWEREWEQPDCLIKSEYGEVIAPVEMLSIITNRSTTTKENPGGYTDWAHFHRSNGSQPGPNNLVRHQIDRRCIKHGSGTWDCIVGEFS